MTAEFIAAQRTDHGVPHAVACRALGVAESTFHKWRGRPPTPAQRRRSGLDVAVKAYFDASGGTHGSPRVRAQLRRDGLAVSKKTVESSMARQGLQGRPPRRRRRGLTRPDKAAAVVPDLLRRDFSAEGPDQKWVGDFKQVNTGEGPVYLATVEDLFSRRMLGFAQSDSYPTAELATAAINMAAAVRGGDVAGVIFHSDKGSPERTQPVEATSACWGERRCSSRASAGVRQPMTLRGRELMVAATASMSSLLHRERSVPLGKYWRRSPLVFSFMPRCQGLWGSAKNTSRPVSIFSWACWASSLPRSQVSDRRSWSGSSANPSVRASRIDSAP